MGIRSYFDWTQREFPHYAQSMTPTMTPIDTQIDILHQTSKIVSSGQTLDDMLKALIRLAAQVTASDACLVYLVEPTGEIVLRASQFSQVIPPGIYRARKGDVCDPQGWYGEETLDVEAVHAMAPGAKVVYVGGSDCLAGLDEAWAETIDNHVADIITNSWGNGTDNIDDLCGILVQLGKESDWKIAFNDLAKIP